MGTRLTLVIHERLGKWARQIRPRVVGWPVRVVETRAARDLDSVLAQAACPLLVIDLGDRPRAGLEDLEHALRLAPDALSLVLDPRGMPEVAPLAREIGATLVLSGMTAPPSVVELLARWVALGRRRAEEDGWAFHSEAAPGDACDDLLMVDR